MNSQLASGDNSWQGIRAIESTLTTKIVTNIRPVNFQITVFNLCVDKLEKICTVMLLIAFIKILVGVQSILPNKKADVAKKLIY